MARTRILLLTAAHLHHLRASCSLLSLFSHLQGRDDDKGLFYKAFFELENTATVVQAQTMVPVLKEMERGQMLGCIIQAELHQGSAVWQKVHGSPGMLSSTGIKGRKHPPFSLTALPLPPCTTQNNTPRTQHCTPKAAQH